MKYFRDLVSYQVLDFKSDYDFTRKQQDLVRTVLRNNCGERALPRKLYCNWGETQNFACLESLDSTSVEMYRVCNLYDEWKYNSDYKKYFRSLSPPAFFFHTREVPVIILCGEDSFCLRLSNAEHSIRINAINQFCRVGLINIWCFEDNINIEQTLYSIKSFADTGRNVPIVVYIIREAFNSQLDSEMFVNNLKSYNIGVVIIDGSAKILNKDEADKYFINSYYGNSYENYLIKYGIIV